MKQAPGTDLFPGPSLRVCGPLGGVTWPLLEKSQFYTSLQRLGPGLSSVFTSDRKSEPLPLVDLFYIFIQKGNMSPGTWSPVLSVGNCLGSHIKGGPWWITVLSTEEAGTQPGP